MKKIHRYGITTLLAGALLLAGCSAGTPDIVGVWSSDDGSGFKTINENGSCSGMYYNNGVPLDIGGGMNCTLGSKDSDGSYTLVVRQPPNERSYQAKFDGDTMVLSDRNGVVVTLTRE